MYKSGQLSQFNLKIVFLVTIGLALLLLICILCIAKHESAPLSGQRPLFANQKIADPENGMVGWKIMNPLYLNDGTFVVFDDLENILVAGRQGNSSDLLTIPGRNGLSNTGAGFVKLPIRKNTAILFDRNGVIEVVDLPGKSSARELFGAITKDSNELRRLFEVAASRP